MLSAAGKASKSAMIIFVEAPPLHSQTEASNKQKSKY